MRGSMKMQKVFSAGSSLTPKASIAACATYIGQKVLGARAKMGSAESRPVTRFSESKKLLLIVLSIVVAGLWSCGGSSSNTPPVIATPSPTATPAPTPTPDVSGACATLPSPSAPGFTARLNQFVMALCYQKQNWEHDVNRRTSQGVHAPFVKLWYSPSLYNWMTVQNRRGPVPDGSIVIKEEYADTDLTSPILFWSGMVRDSSLWWDGWDWSVVGSESGGIPAPTPTPSANGCAAVAFPLNGPTSVNCIGCHASAISNSPGTGTFSTTNFPLTTSAVGSGSPADSTNGSAAASMLADAHLPGFVTTALGQYLPTPANPNPAAGFTGRLPSSIFAHVRMLPAATTTVPCMVPQTQDFVYSKPAKVGGPSLFVTSNQCASCHDATDNTPMPTHMLYTPPGASIPLNLSTAGEWQYSMTALAARDPIFLAQVDTESTVHSNIQGKPNPPGFVQDTCLSCHGVMGQRQFHLDKGNAPGTYFTRDQLQDPTSPYGALARDGVSCAVCHHMADKNLDDPSTYTGKFIVGPANVVYGPYPSGDGNVKVGDNVIPQPMINSVGIVPVFGAQVGGAKVCASCHTIVLPVYDAHGNQVKTEFEQTTYLEWLNSSFVSKNQPCQNCHMLDNFKGAKLEFQVANIEDSTFPVVPEIGPPTSLPPDQLILQNRTFYARHQISGINVFALEMFDQFQADLGLYYGKMGCYRTTCKAKFLPRKMRLTERSFRRRRRPRK